MLCSPERDHWQRGREQPEDASSLACHVGANTEHRIEQIGDRHAGHDAGDAGRDPFEQVVALAFENAPSRRQAARGSPSLCRPSTAAGSASVEVKG